MNTKKKTKRRWSLSLTLACVYLVATIAANCLYADDPVATPRPAVTSSPHDPPPASDFTSLMFVLMLATFIGLGVITRVSRLLHTPLMSLTNAISAIAVVGAIMVAGSGNHSGVITFLGAVALFASVTNIVSGFLITDRMLKMFKQRERS